MAEQPADGEFVVAPFMQLPARKLIKLKWSVNSRMVVFGEGTAGIETFDSLVEQVGVMG